MNNKMDIKLNSKIYPLEAILNACYVFIDRAYIYLDADAKGKSIKIYFKAKDKLSQRRLEGLRGEFMNELLYSNLRYQISKNNKKIREYIVSRALYSALSPANLFSSDEKMSYQGDPLGIATPWEEKLSKKKKDARVKI
jgi:His-Xaa-Ser system protein HxsD